MADDSPTQLELATEVLTLCNELVNKEDVGSGVNVLSTQLEQMVNQGLQAPAYNMAVTALHKLTTWLVESLMLNTWIPTMDKVDRLQQTSMGLLTCARENNEAKNTAIMMMTRGLVLCIEKDNQKAVTTAKAALKAIRKLGNQELEVQALNGIIIILCVRSNTKASKYVLESEHSEQKIQQIKDRRDIILEEALTTARQAEEIQREREDMEGLAEALLKVAQVYAQREDVDEARQVAEQAQNTFDSLGDVRGQMRCLNVSVDASLIRDEDIADAVESAREAVTIFQQTKAGKQDRRGEADAVHMLARTLLTAYELDDALKSAEEALEIYKDITIRSMGEAAVLHTIAMIKASKEETEDAAVEAFKAVKVYKEVKDKSGEAYALHQACALDFQAMFAELNKDPKNFTQDQAERLEEKWKNVVRALELFQELKDENGEAGVQQTIDDAMHEAREIHKKVVEPSKTYIKMNRLTRMYEGEQHFWDVDDPNFGQAPPSEAMEVAS